MYKSEGNISYAYIINYNNQEILVVNNHFESNHLSEADKRGYKEWCVRHLKEETRRWKVNAF